MNNIKSFKEFKLNEEQYYDGESLMVLYILVSIILGFILMIIGSGDNILTNIIRKYLLKMKSAKYYTQEINELVVELSEDQRKKLKVFIKKSVFIKWSKKDFFGFYDNEYYENKKKIFDEELKELLTIFNQEQRVVLITLLGKMQNELERQFFRNWGYEEGRDKNPDFRPLKKK